MILGWLSGIWGRVLAAGGLVLGILAGVALIFRKGEQAGAARMREAEAKARDKALADRRSSDEVVDNLSDADVRRRLRERWGKG